MSFLQAIAYQQSGGGGGPLDLFFCMHLDLFYVRLNVYIMAKQ